MSQSSIERFVEELGILLELEAGTARMVGRTLGWLLVCEPPEQSAAELAEMLQASKGSISTATRVLLRMGLVERVRFRGERFDRFRVQPEAWDEFFWRDEQFKTPRRVLRIGLDARAGGPPGRPARRA
jgi:DNA-binding transcriptional regulator GbsR (MarR family)